ncbi:MAG: hypothetical protein JST12_14540 [Armatimonadetes bacterium]|nr:hypothetical protein [Armatimonadota bacterium]
MPVLSDLFLHRTTSQWDKRDGDGVDVTYLVTVKDWTLEENTEVVPIPVHWVEQYLQPLVADLAPYDLALEDEPTAFFMELIGKEGAARFVRMVEYAFVVVESKVARKNKFNQWLASGFTVWLEENYIELLKDDAKEAEIKRHAEVIA